MKNTIFTGAGVAIITPMLEDGSVDYAGLAKNIDFQIENGTDAIIICGTTGESSTLDDKEHRECIRFAVEHTHNRIPVIAGTGSNDTKYAIELSQEAQELGANGLLIVTPYYNKTTQRGLVAHYNAIADSVDLPIILYNVPSRTGVGFDVSTVAALAEHKNIAAIKEASGSLEQVDEIIKNKPARFDVISGDDALTFSMVASGAAGSISVIGNALPKEVSRMIRLEFKGEYEAARTIHHRFTELYSLLFIDGNPAGVKALLHEMGFIENVLRLPLVPTRITTLQKMTEILKTLKI